MAQRTGSQPARHGLRTFCRMGAAAWLLGLSACGAKDTSSQRSPVGQAGQTATCALNPMCAPQGGTTVQAGVGGVAIGSAGAGRGDAPAGGGGAGAGAMTAAGAGGAG